jgi:hypothetical protein
MYELCVETMSCFLIQKVKTPHVLFNKESITPCLVCSGESLLTGNLFKILKDSHFLKHDVEANI